MKSGMRKALWPSCILVTLFLYGAVTAVEPQLSWTPIYVDTTNQLDLWTVKERGCECPEDVTSRACACCVRPGGCLCSFNRNRCAQCGLEDACQRFCNVSISSWTVATQSSLSWIQLKSPVLQGPTSCWWRLESEPGQRIEVQVHRLISVGAYDNGTQKCTKGFVQFADGDIISPSINSVQLCAENSRFSPPVVVFGDKGVATLLLRLSGKTTRSQMLAYVSFSAIDDPVVGDPTEGGRLKPHSVCDWIYDNCWPHRECILVSPGYPGLSPPYRTCRYFLEGNATTSRIRLRFHALSFPKPQQCSTHRLTIWRNVTSAGTTTTTDLGPPWKVLCEDSESVVDIADASHAVLEFKSGATTTPFIHNGFRAMVEFIQTSPATPAPSPITAAPTTTTSTHAPTRPYKHFPQAQTTKAVALTTTPSPPKLKPKPRYEEIDAPLGNPRSSFGGLGMGLGPERLYPITCGHIFEGESTRGGVFRLLIPKDISVQLPRAGAGNTVQNYGSYHQQTKKQNLGAPFRCQIEFRGRAADIVQFAAFSFQFRGSNCSTTMEVYDMAPERGSNHSDRLLGKICGPSESAGSGAGQHYTSSYSRMALVALIFPQDEPAGNEFLEGAFRFHDESLDGTAKPMSSCETVYYGVASVATGTITGPSDSPLLTRLSTFPLVCAHSFVPGPNQTVVLALNRAGHESTAVVPPAAPTYCRTICKTSGCVCETLTGSQSRYTPMSQVDHLLLVSGAAAPIACLCGYFKDLLPLAFESHTPLTLVYHATSASREFSYSAGFQFKRKITCANFTIQPPSSSKRWKEVLAPAAQYYGRHGGGGGHLHYSYYQCLWPVSIPTRYKLSINFISEENEDDCRTWNLTLWAGNNLVLDPAPEDMLYSFCPKQGRKEFQMPDSLDGAFIQLTGVTVRPPQFEIRWKYIDVMLGSGFLTERKVTNDSDSTVVVLNLNLLTSLLVIMLIVHKLILVTSSYNGS